MGPYRETPTGRAGAPRTPLLRLVWAALTLRLLWIWWQRQREWIWVRTPTDFGGAYIEHVRMLKWRARRLRARWERRERAEWRKAWRRQQWRAGQREEV